MSDLLSAQLLREMNDNLSESEDEPIEEIDIGEIDVKYTMIPGLRKGSSLIWAYEAKNLYYKNAYSKVNRLESCKCYKPKCNARLYIREDGTAFRHSNVEHAKIHGSMYTEFKLMYCFNKMKEKAATAPASTTTFQIYQDAVLE